MIEFRSNEAAIIVALLAEGVDRNLDFADITGQEVGRPPRGGRG